MLELKIVQAEFGDCMILEYGSSQSPRYMLIDGGPGAIYDRHLKGELQSIQASGAALDLAVLSHVDNDHIVGLLDLLSELRQQRTNGDPETIGVGGVWHNSFRRSIDMTGTIQTRFQAIMASVAGARGNLQHADNAFNGIAEGNKMRLDCTALNIPTNQGFPGDLISVDGSPNAISFGNLQIRIVGPTSQNLNELRLEWTRWLDDHENIDIAGDPFLASYADESVPNLSSIMFMAEADGKKILFTGDGRGDHLIQGLTQAGLTASDGSMHVDVMKLPHHGSDRNVTKGFFRTITADKYVASANGRHGNPDLATLIWIVEAAKEAHRDIEMIATNETHSTRQLVQNYPPGSYGYTMTIMQNGNHSISLPIA